MKFLWSMVMIGVIGFAMVIPVWADSSPGDVVVVMGEDLSPKDRELLLERMDLDKDTSVTSKEVMMMDVTNKEEHHYLGSYLPKAVIGSKAISSAKITIGESGSGLVVESEHITYVSNDMYVNALSTAGVTDAHVFVTAPFDVSGTGALTGIIKAYESSMGESISEDQKQVANEEMVTTVELSKDKEIGQDKAAELIKRIKEEVSKENPKTEEELTALIERVAADLGISLTADQVNQLVSLFQKIKELNIDWQAVGDGLEKAKEKWNAFKDSEEGQGFLNALGKLWDAVVGFFSGLFK